MHTPRQRPQWQSGRAERQETEVKPEVSDSEEKQRAKIKAKGRKWKKRLEKHDHGWKELFCHPGPGRKQQAGSGGSPDPRGPGPGVREPHGHRRQCLLARSHVAQWLPAFGAERRQGLKGAASRKAA